jgi:hypothetical protein
MPSIFAVHHPAKVPNPRIMQNADQDESRQMTAHDGLCILPDAPCPFAEIVSAPEDYQSVQMEKGIYLWVIEPSQVLCMKELAPIGQTLSQGKVKHTNLTGGAPACSGGEMWFSAGDVIYVSGSSGRYGPSSADELLESAHVFKRKEYKTCCLGWDDGIGRPAQNYRAEVAQWI